MGNALTYRNKLRQEASKSISNGLKSFIQNECPIFLESLYSNDIKLKNIVVKQFNEYYTNKIFDNIYQILPFLEELRYKRLKKLESLTSSKFQTTSSIKFSCLPCKINNCFTLAYFDTGCSISCITFKNACKLGLINLINKNVNGVAVGFGCNRKIIGILPCIPVQIENNLTFNINFVVINYASADFLLIGADFMHKQKIKIDYSNGTFIFPKQIINEYTLKFVPTNLDEREHYLNFFKYDILKYAENRFDFFMYNSNLIESNDANYKTQNSNLYIRISINGMQMLALIDSGADTSKISDNLAYKLNISSYIDYQKYKVAHGLGSVISIGRIPPIPVQFDKVKTLFIPFEVLKENKLNILLLGSDFFTYYGCFLDFEQKSIYIPLKANRSYKLEEQTPYEVELNQQLDYFFKPCAELENLRSNLSKKKKAYQLKKKILNRIDDLKIKNTEYEHFLKTDSEEESLEEDAETGHKITETNKQIDILNETNQKELFHNDLLPSLKGSILSLKFI